MCLGACMVHTSRHIANDIIYVMFVSPLLPHRPTKMFRFTSLIPCLESSERLT